MGVEDAAADHGAPRQRELEGTSDRPGPDDEVSRRRARRGLPELLLDVPGASHDEGVLAGHERAEREAAVGVRARGCRRERVLAFGDGGAVRQALPHGQHEGASQRT